VTEGQKARAILKSKAEALVFDGDNQANGSAESLPNPQSADE
jgi:hypothetical protein